VGCNKNYKESRESQEIYEVIKCPSKNVPEFLESKTLGVFLEKF